METSDQILELREEIAKLRERVAVLEAAAHPMSIPGPSYWVGSPGGEIPVPVILF